MSRARSKTVDSTEVKKSGLPRRLTEKIALMKEKEQAQSEAFEQAMQSIFEMQQARLHGGGGSMPSLQAIDSSQYPPSSFPVTVDNNGCLTTPQAYHKERPHSGGPTGRNMAVERTLSYDADNQMRPNVFWNVTNEWGGDGDLSRHKSDSDLQQSLTDCHQQIPMAHTPPVFQPSTPPTLFPPSPHIQHNHHYITHHDKIQKGTNPPELDLWNQSQNRGQVIPGSSINTSLLSPPDHNMGGVIGDPNLIGSASSLPDLTNIEFSSGLDVPIEQDEDSPTYSKTTPFHFPFIGPSKLAFSSMMAQPCFPSPLHYTFPNHDGMIMNEPHTQSLLNNSITGTIPRSPTMPEFRTHPQLSAPPFRKFKPIVPAGSNVSNQKIGGYHTSPVSYNHLKGFVPVCQKLPEHSIVINDNHSGVHGSLNGINPSTHFMQSPTGTNPSHSISSPTFVQSSIGTQSSPTILQYPPLNSPTNNIPLSGSESMVTTHPNFPNSLPSVTVDSSMLLDPSLTQPSSPQKPPSLASTSSSGYVSLPPHLDPSMFYQQQRYLQQKMANISFATPVRSHSEENLIKMQKDTSKGDVIQHNPFMGNMSNASSVPCVYVESNNVDPCVDDGESHTTGTGSPSTSASHASSPPMLRPVWFDHPHAMMNEFVFQDWPIEAGVMAGVSKQGSPLSHHKSLTELNKIGGVNLMELSPSTQNKSHQLSLPSIVMGDLIAMDEQLEKQGSGPFLPTDFEMEEEVMESLLRDDGFVSFDVDMLNPSHVMMESSNYYQNQNMNF